MEYSSYGIDCAGIEVMQTAQNLRTKALKTNVSRPSAAGIDDGEDVEENVRRKNVRRSESGAGRNKMPLQGSEEASKAKPGCNANLQPGSGRVMLVSPTVSLDAGASVWRGQRRCRCRGEAYALRYSAACFIARRPELIAHEAWLPGAVATS